MTAGRNEADTRTTKIISRKQVRRRELAKCSKAKSLYTFTIFTSKSSVAFLTSIMTGAGGCGKGSLSKDQFPLLSLTSLYRLHLNAGTASILCILNRL
jgi:hypothetical protein